MYVVLEKLELAHHLYRGSTSCEAVYSHLCSLTPLCYTNIFVSDLLLYFIFRVSVHMESTIEWQISCLRLQKEDFMQYYMLIMV